MKDNIGKVYSALQKKRKKIKKRSIFFILFLFGVNAYAWFVYMSNANVGISSSVSTWNVSFYDGSQMVKELNIKTNDLYPGMENFTKQLVIKNDSDVRADFSYEIDRLNILGVETTPGIDGTESAVTSLNNDLPFKTTFSYDKDILEENDTINFNILIEWPYEATNSYYKLNSIYEYDSSYKYYSYNGTSYIEDVNVNSSNFLTKVVNGIYIESDDADSYWGERCKKYKDTSGNEYCYSFHIKLKVIQKNG